MLNTNSTTARRRIFDGLAAERWQADQAAREQPNAVLLANALERAGELAQLGRLVESRRVLDLNYHTR